MHRDLQHRESGPKKPHLALDVCGDSILSQIGPSFLTCRRIQSSVVPPSATARAAGSGNGNSPTRPDHRCKPNLKDASMAEQSLTTPGAVSRRFLFSAAVALPVATVAAGSSPGGVSPGLLALLKRYRDTCLRLREVEADQAEKLLSIPAASGPVLPTAGACHGGRNGRGRN